MCGIVGYAGENNAAPILLDGLEKLEYRGYDSAGLATIGKSGIDIIKAKGRLAALKERTENGKLMQGTVGLGHTRWATHGKPSDENSHPHTGGNGRVAIVHNGIIENYNEIKEMLKNRGRSFYSETDTEVAAQLIDYCYKGNILEAVAEAVREMRGSYALGVMCSEEPETLIAVKCRAPLIVAYTENGNMFASDVTAVLKYTKEITYLDDDEIAVITKTDAEFYTPFLDKLSKKRELTKLDVSAADKGGFEHYMLKEITEQPEAVRRTTEKFIKNSRVDLSEVLPEAFARKIGKIFIVACGSSYHVGMAAKYNIEKLARTPTEVVYASEFRYSDPLVDKASLVILISQSGETADTLEALREAKRLGAETLSVVNVKGSSIAKASEHVIYTKAGPEIAVATTKAYSAQLAVMALIALYLADLRGTVSSEEYSVIVSELEALPEKLERIIKNRADIQYPAYRYFNNEKLFFIGRNTDYALSLEGSLKLKEISYMHSEAYAAGELKHGTISLIEEGTPVIAVVTCRRLAEKTVSNASEVRARGARVMTVTAESMRSLVEHESDDVITVPDTHEALMPSVSVVPLQLFAYYIALYRGCDIDKPRNLAKSVTVE
ncbi:MAG: glutamine--fructose-6-phosphate transaminase (isomerizing) [Oscillospiraceae bacterium]|nr:glutamine--fructose-6-phosphate transaminase (isomerizing) [Oscillospiraceae bacterium]